MILGKLSKKIKILAAIVIAGTFVLVTVGNGCSKKMLSKPDSAVRLSVEMPQLQRIRVK